MDINCLSVYEYPKVRIGPNHDGGYVVGAGFSYDAFFSFGIGGGVQFELDFLNQYNIPYFAYDGTLSNSKIESFKSVNINVNRENITASNNLYKKIATYDDVFLAMDIEGHELNWFKGNAPLKNIKQMVVEFHLPFEKGFGKIFEKINKTHYLIHIHLNNYAEPPFDNFNMPRIFECTYIRKDELKLNYNSLKLPSHIDFKSCAQKEEIDLNFFPFVR